MEKFFLRALLARKKLNIVDQQCIYRAIETLELVDGVELQSLDHVCDETLGMQVDHLGIRVLLEQMVTHSVHQVSLTQANATVKEQRVIAMLRVVCDLPGRSAGKLVGFTLNEILKGKGAVQVTGVLERTFNLYGTLLGTHRRRLRAGASHGIEAVTRGFFFPVCSNGHSSRYRCRSHRGRRRCSRHGLGLRRSHGRSQRSIRRGTRRRATTASY
ncbi:hypothetical protein D3C76_1170460 [compost metagenome]